MHKAYPHIEKLKNVLHDINEEDNTVTTIKFRGTVKAHGTNGGIVLYPDGNIVYQSRNMILKEDGDNHGFVGMIKKSNPELLFRQIKHNLSEQKIEHVNATIAIYGEYCGNGIQKGVAISQAAKFFMIFDIQLLYPDGTCRWLNILDMSDIKNHEHRIYNVGDFPVYYADVNISVLNPGEEIMRFTNEVSKQCPIGKFLGYTGCGEGIVWTNISSVNNNLYQFRFKTKGDDYIAATEPTEDKNNKNNKNNKNIQETYVNIPESRLKQGLDYLRETGNNNLNMSHIKKYIDWVVEDSLREERDIIDEHVRNGIDIKKITSAISNTARIWYMKNHI